MKLKHLMILAPALSVALATSSAWSADLMDVYREAQDSDPQIQAALAAYQAVTTLRPQAKAGLLPNVGLGADLERHRYDDQTSGGTDSYATNRNISLNLRQPLYNRERFVALDQSEARIAQAEAQFESARQNLALRAAEGYFNVLSARAEVEFAQSEKTSTSRQLEQSNKRFEVGMIAITDVNEAQAAYDAAVAAEIAALNQLANAREALRELTGEYHEDLASLSPQTPMVPPEPADMDAWTEVAMAQNLAVQAAEHGVQVARHEVDIQRSGHYPTLDATASHGYTDSQFGGIIGVERYDTAVGLELNVPIYQGGGIRARTQQAAYLLNQEKEQLDSQRRTALRQTRDAFRGVQTGISQVNALQQSIVSADSALEATQAGFDVGTRTIVDVLVAQRNLFQAQRNYAQARYSYIVNMLRLKQAAGTLSPEDLQEVNRWLVDG